MDLIKIGKYIAEKRKELGMTQKQLAEKLGMSDKSVSKWERGVCLPDVSVYSDLCRVLGIGIHEFLAGEDIPQEEITQKSEETILGVAADSKRKQHRLKIIICGLLSVFLLALAGFGVMIYLENRPQNFIAPVEEDSVERKTAELLSNSDRAHIYNFTTTEEYDSLELYLSEYHSGELVSKRRTANLGFGAIGSPKNGKILIVPNFEDFEVNLVIAATERGTGSTSCSILEGVPEREYYGRSATELCESTEIRYNEEQPLAALIYDNDMMSVPGIYDLLDDSAGCLAENDYVYFFSFVFNKE